MTWDYAAVQRIAKNTMLFLRQTVKPGMRLTKIRTLCEDKMRELGADSFWYWDIGAFVFAGNETALSVSGRDYQTSDRVIGENDILTVDLSPQRGKIWGDYARTIILENGRVANDISRIQNDEWRSGLQAEEKLHAGLLRYARPDLTFDELYHHFNQMIAAEGICNLDFLGNLGHSIAQEKDDRIYIENGNHAPLSSVSYFTFEPHIGLPGSEYGFKKENIYYFEDGELREL